LPKNIERTLKKLLAKWEILNHLFAKLIGRL
jgi:hypothetical protein